jgi:alkylation response protein AidB-like acyl-CoA dehydrogenase
VLGQAHRSIFTDEHHWFRESVRAFVEKEVAPHAHEARQRHELGRGLWLAAGLAGLLGLGVDEELGGSGTDDFRFNAILGEELATAGLAFASSIGIQTDVVSPYLTKLTTAEQRQRWLPDFCAGRIVTAIGMTEPGAGSDLASLRTTATRTDGAWLLNGAKTFITNGSSADLVIVAARTRSGSRREGITLFGVESGMGGFSRGAKLAKLGQHEADTAELFLDNVCVPDTNVIGEVDGGFRHMMEHLPQERLSVACVNLGHARAALTSTLGYVKERHAFGRPIGTFQNSRFALARAVTDLDVGQAFVDQCLMRHVAGTLTTAEASQAKWWSSEVQDRILDTCVQLHGGYGYMEEYSVARAWVDARVTRIWAGATEIMQEVVGRALALGEPK